ncbi:MAG: hypothetical protein V3W37_02970 [Candidatus Binatia bacterium]
MSWGDFEQSSIERCLKHSKEPDAPCPLCASNAKKLEAAEELAAKWLGKENKHYDEFNQWIKELDELALIIQGKE